MSEGLTMFNNVTTHAFFNQQNQSHLDNFSTFLLYHKTLKITSLVFDKKGHHLVSASLDRIAKLWNTNNMKEERLLLSGHNGWIWGATYHQFYQDEKIFTISEDRTVRAWFRNSDDIAKMVKKRFPIYKEQGKASGG